MIATEAPCVYNGRVYVRVPLADRFWPKVDTSAGLFACWPWTGGKRPGGYGHVNVGRGRYSGAHRIAYELTVGPIPEGLTLDHLCRNTSCVNPAHLEPVTRGENVLRGEGLSARAARATHCPRGHAYDSANTYRTPQGHRKCITCVRALKREWDDRRAGR